MERSGLSGEAFGGAEPSKEIPMVPKTLLRLAGRWRATPFETGSWAGLGRFGSLVAPSSTVLEDARDTDGPEDTLAPGEALARDSIWDYYERPREGFFQDLGPARFTSWTQLMFQDHGRPVAKGTHDRS